MSALPPPVAGPLPPQRRGLHPWISVALPLVGAGLALALLQDHLTVAMGNHAEGLFCSGAGHFDCNPVAAHPASWTLGMPVAFWGLLFYITLAGIGLLMLRAPEGERAAAVTLGAMLCTVGMIVDVSLGYVMVTQIGTICLTCVASYAVNLVLTAIYWTAFARERSSASWRELFRGWMPRPATDAADVIRIPYKLLVGVLMLLGLGFATWFGAGAVMEVRSIAHQEVTEFLASMNEPPTVDMHRFEGLPSRGPANAPLTIVVAADFQCTWCRGLSANLLALEREYPGQIREVYLHAPLTDTCGPPVRDDIDSDPCWLAETGVCATEQGKFWEYHDYLFSKIPLGDVVPTVVVGRLRDIGLDSARVMACQRSGAARAEIEREVALRDTLHLEATPSIVIRGHVKAGGISLFSLRSIVRGLLNEPR